MATTTDPQVIMMHLGYSKPEDFPEDYTWLLQLTGPVAAKVDNLVQQIEAVDAAIATARIDSMAVTVGELKVDYLQHLAVLYKEGARLLQELSNLLHIPVVFNKYFGSYVQAKSRMVVKNYW